MFGVAYSGSTTSCDLGLDGGTSTTARLSVRVSAYATSSTPAFMTTSAAETYARITGQCIVAGSGNLTIQGRRTSSGTLNVRAGSWMSAYKFA